MRSQSAKILYNEEVAPDYFRLGLLWKAPRIVPGNFVMVRVGMGLDPLLRRPFGIYKVLGGRGKNILKGNGIELLYKVVGKGTRILSEREAGESMEILGPLGNGFPEAGRGKKVIMVGGGMGIVPLYLLARSLEQGVMLYGARGKAEAGLARDFKGLDCRLKISTEDGSVGRKGLVTGLLSEEIIPGSVVYACGPVGMLKAVSKIAQKEGVKCYVSLERSMACGIGVCLGCAVKSKNHEEDKENRNYKMVCSEGPVFDSEDIDWESL